MDTLYTHHKVVAGTISSGRTSSCGAARDLTSPEAALGDTLMVSAAGSRTTIWDWRRDRTFTFMSLARPLLASADSRLVAFVPAGHDGGHLKQVTCAIGQPLTTALDLIVDEGCTAGTAIIFRNGYSLAYEVRVRERRWVKR